MTKSSGFKMKGSPMQRNFGISPVKEESKAKKTKVTTTYNKDGSYTKSDGTRSTTYTLNPDYDPKSGKGRNYKYTTGGKNPDGTPVGE